MVTVRYEIVEHDGGWAYKAGGAISETYPTHDAALKAANAAAARQTLAGTTDGIVYQDKDGQWHEELADGRDRPATRVVDEPSA
ncbi:DUF2188 domain-containing protein [Frigidibacter sp.]|jgi:hypothetical protein|uniref:DUF2188 domain-containing protein n=1 Tax=Frigidibacter sp. TaxID=2586418 RepID=UPI0027360FA0|nr:DUF2188 domain-containing protein [Frigidibacter sp.]MDP3342307.1 DUF2188 domain-containing protein [Frigidibacter sp.]